MTNELKHIIIKDKLKSIAESVNCLMVVQAHLTNQKIIVKCLNECANHTFICGKDQLKDIRDSIGNLDIHHLEYGEWILLKSQILKDLDDIISVM